MLNFLVVIILSVSHICEGRSIPGPSQNDTLDLIEKVYLHTDRDTYFAGDDIWFKAYLVDAMDHLLSNHSNNLHVELIYPDLKIISSRVVRLNEGLGNGDFKLPDNICSGRYIIRAYTNYMRNFSDELFFTKEITIVSAKENEEEIPVKYINGTKNISLDFFPEGGSLVENVSSLVAFKAVDNRGLGCSIKGKIYSSDGKSLNTFRSSQMGMGSFLLRPLPGVKYYAMFSGSDSTEIRADLPASLPQGVALSTSRSHDNELIVNIKTNDKTLSILSDHDLILGISIRKSVIKTIPIRIKTPVTRFIIPTGYLPEGILMLTLASSNGLPLSEKLVYIEKKPPKILRIQTDKLSYEKREPVSLKISISGDSLHEEKSNVSLSVVNKTFINSMSEYPGTVTSWFLLESDVHGSIENPSYYFDPSNPDRLKNLDLLLLTQGWRDFSWKYDTVYYQPEDGFTISGKLKTNTRKQPVSEYRASIAIFGKENSLVTTTPVDSSGKFRLSGIDLTGQASVIISGIDSKNNPCGTLIIDSVRYTPPAIPAGLGKVPSFSTGNNSLLKSYYISDSLKKIYKLSDTIIVGEINIISERSDPQSLKIASSRLKYGIPEAQLKITDQMLGYNDVLHLLKGKIPGVEVLADTGITIRGAGSLDVGIKPLILIDGNQATFDDLLRIPIFDLDRIDVLKSAAASNIYGFLGYAGVINLITKAGVSGNYRSPEYTSKIKISGFNAPRIFYSPQHSQVMESDYRPDLRNTLLWDPDFNLNGTRESILKFYNSDNSSTVRIIAEGITENGIPISGKAEYEVR